jgi:hypothetical protein
VTSQKAQIQALISEIDEVLNKTSPRLPWVMSSDAVQQRQVLEQTRAYLTSLQQQTEAASASVAIVHSDSVPPTIETPVAQPPVAQTPIAQTNNNSAEVAQQVLQAVLQEMNYLRSNMLQPLRADVETLQQQREALTQEIRQLEAQRQQYALPQPQQVNQQALIEFLQSAMGQMQQNLSGQVTEMLASLSAQSASVHPALSAGAATASEASIEPPAISPAQRLEQIQKVQAQSDQLLNRLDSTLHVLFESLQNNVQTYQDSLEQGLSRMHGLGQQGEAIFTAVVNRLAQQLGREVGREASSFLKSSVQPHVQPEPANPLPGDLPTSRETSTTEIAKILDELDALERSESEANANPQATSQIANQLAQIDLQEQPVDNASLEDDRDNSGLENLDALDLELSQLDLTAIATEPDPQNDDDLALFQGDEEFLALFRDAAGQDEFAAAQARELNRDLDRNLDTSSTGRGAIAPAEAAKIEDLESALDLLNQLSAEVQQDAATPVTWEATWTESSEQPSSEPESAVPATELVTTPENLYSDEFYQSSFEDQQGPTVNGTTTTEPNEDLFAGLADPAQANSPPVEDIFSEFPFAGEPQTVENFLLNTQPTQVTPAEPDPEELFSNFAEQRQEQPLASQPLVEESLEASWDGVETIASLSELIPALEPEANGEFANPERSTPLSGEDPFSSPGFQFSEDLASEAEAEGWDLFTDSSDTQPAQLDPATATEPASEFEAATADLFPENLFPLDAPISQAESPDSATRDAAERVLENNAFTLEGLEGLFEGLPSRESVADRSLAAFEPDNSEPEGLTLEEMFNQMEQTTAAPSTELDASADTPFLEQETPTEDSAKKKIVDFEEVQDEGSGIADLAPSTKAGTRETVLGLMQDLTQDLVPESAPGFQSPTSDLAETPFDLDDRTTPLESPSEQPPPLNAAYTPAIEAPPPQEPADAVPPPAARSPHIPAKWYLGIDFGTTGISAVLLNQLTCHLYPIYWQKSPVQAEAPEQTDQGNRDREHSDRQFRLPATVSLTPDLLLHDFKPYLKLGIPHYSAQAGRWEPVLQWSDQLQVSLSSVCQALQKLLATLVPPAAPEMTCRALGLEEEEFQVALQQLAGVVVGHPANWSDTYSFNLREAILSTKLVTDPAQIFLIEDAIATLLSVLPSAKGQEMVLPPSQGQALHLHSTAWQGSTLALSAGATLTELALINLPESLENLTHQDFQIRSLPYAGNGIDQDIICQLLYPALISHPVSDSEHQAEESVSPELNTELADSAEVYDFVLQSIDLKSLELENLPLPVPGEPDLPSRYRLQRRLESSRSGQVLLEAARTLKLVLQQQNRFTFRLGSQSWTVLRQDLASQVLLPYIQRLNRELNTLLAKTNTPALAVNQVICTGGTASLGAIARWLQQKLPNATIVQDTYVRSSSIQTNCISSCSRVAYGLAALPLHPQVIDLPRQQYNDYFLLLELLRVFPNRPVSIGEILKMLERRNINTQTCQSQILALLEGHLPPGLVPSPQDTILLTPQSYKNPDYKAIQVAPLFLKQGQTYRPNHYQWNRLRQHLDTLLSGSRQNLAQPLSVSL